MKIICTFEHPLSLGCKKIAPMSQIERFNFWKPDWSERITLIWNPQELRFTTLKRVIRLKLGRGFTYERSLGANITHSVYLDPKGIRGFLLMPHFDKEGLQGTLSGIIGREITVSEMEKIAFHSEWDTPATFRKWMESEFGVDRDAVMGCYNSCASHRQKE
jgi:hypothetical protein